MNEIYANVIACNAQILISTSSWICLIVSFLILSVPRATQNHNPDVEGNEEEIVYKQGH